MWLGLQTVSSLERCPIFRLSFIEKFHCNLLLFLATATVMILPLLLDTAHCSLNCYSLTTTTGPSHSTQIRYNKPLLQDTVHYPHCVHGYIHNITPLLRIKDTSQYTRHTMGPSIGSCFGGIYLSMLLL